MARLDVPGDLVAWLAGHGRPIRYGEPAQPWPVSAYQTVFANEPGSAEMPSAARGFTAELVTSLVSGGVVVAPLVLHCGVSSPEAGEAPQPERYCVPASTAALVNAASAAGRRIVAVGTTAVRALETVTDESGSVHPGEGWTELVISPDRGVRALDALITGWHEPEAKFVTLRCRIRYCVSACGPDSTPARSRYGAVRTCRSRTADFPCHLTGFPTKGRP